MKRVVNSEEELIDTVTGYPFDGYDGTDESFDDLIDLQYNDRTKTWE